MVLFDCQPHKICSMCDGQMSVPPDHGSQCMHVHLYTLLDLTRHEICISTRVATLTIHARKKYIVNEHIICICPGITCIVLLMEVISCNKLTFPLICLLLLSQTGIKASWLLPCRLRWPTKSCRLLHNSCRLHAQQL